MKVTTSNSEVMTTSDVIIIAVKPYLVLTVLSEIHDFYTSAQSSGTPPKNLRPLIVSVAASVPLSDIESKVSLAFIIVRMYSVNFKLIPFVYFLSADTELLVCMFYVIIVYVKGSHMHRVEYSSILQSTFLECCWNRNGH